MIRTAAGRYAFGPGAAETAADDASLLAHELAVLGRLRAAVSLAHLWGDQDRNTDAYHLFSPIYAWFSEGFHSADLKSAKLSLDELSA